jgi:hypothetical protein
VADIVSPAQEATVVGRKKRNPGEVMGGHSIPGPGGPAATGRIVSNALESTRLVNQSAATVGRWSCVDDQRTLVNQPLLKWRRSLQLCLATDVSGSGASMPAAM